MAFTVNEIGNLTIVTGGGYAGDYATGWSASNYYHITDLNTAGSAQLHSFVLFYKGTQTDAGSSGELAIPLFGDKDNTGGITLGIDGGYLAISDGTTITRGTTLINDDDWHSIIFAVGDTTVKGYADGVLEVNVTPSNLSTVILNAIGNSAGATAYPTAIDGIQIYDRYLYQFMVDDFEANIDGFPTASSYSFDITDNVVTTYSNFIKPTENLNHIEPQFQNQIVIPNSVQGVGTNENYRIISSNNLFDIVEPLPNINVEDNLNYDTVTSTQIFNTYIPLTYDDLEDTLPHKTIVVRVYAQDAIVVERWF